MMNSTIKSYKTFASSKVDEDAQQQYLKAYDQYAEAIYRHCFFRVFSQNLAEDLVQETFMRAWKYVAKGEIIGNIRALLYRIANNLIIDESRKKKEQSLETLMEEPGGFQPSYDGHKEIEKKLLLREVVEDIHGLSPNYRVLLLMRYVDDLDPKEIAEILQMSVNNVSVKINRALTKLKAQFNH